MCLDVDSAIQGHCARPDLRPGRGAQEARHRTWLCARVARAGWERRGPAGGTLQLVRSPPGAISAWRAQGQKLARGEGRLRAWRLQVPDAPENIAYQLHIDRLRMMLNKYRANLERWSGPA